MLLLNFVDYTARGALRASLVIDYLLNYILYLNLIKIIDLGERLTRLLRECKNFTFLITVTHKAVVVNFQIDI